MNNEVYILYSNCIPVRGAKKSIICDLQRHSYISIPNDLFIILKKHKGKSIQEIKTLYSNKYDDIIENYFQILLKNEFTFPTNTPNLFPNIDMKWEEPYELTNAIIDINKNSKFNVENVLKQLSHLNCKFIQLRFFNKITVSKLNDILNYFCKLKSNSLGVDVFLPYYRSLTNSECVLLFKSYNRLTTLIIHSSYTDRNIQQIGSSRYLIHTSVNLISEKDCGIIDKTMFSINIKTFTESLKYNSCLNGKISIDINGEIKNCPSMLKSYGNVNEIKIVNALQNKSFKKYWKISKDNIIVCKDCEFRYICTDCRAYIEKPDDKYSKPLKCGYNPYTNKWEEWSANPLKQKAVQYYGMQEMVKKDV